MNFTAKMDRSPLLGNAPLNTWDQKKTFIHPLPSGKLAPQCCNICTPLGKKHGKSVKQGQLKYKESKPGSGAVI